MIHAHRHLLYALFLLASARLAAQATATAVFEPAAVETGDTFRLKIVVNGVQHKPAEVDFSPWENTLPKDNLLSKRAWTQSAQRWVADYTFIAFDSAIVQLPPLKIILHLGESVLTNPVELRVVPTGADADLSAMDDIRDIRREPLRWYDYWPWITGACALLFAAGWYLRRRPKRPPIVAAPPAPPPATTELPHETALRLLRALAEKKLWNQGQIKAYYEELTHILRLYIEQRYAIPALESTTHEIIQSLKQTDFPPDRLRATGHLLEQADLAKFAKARPPQNYHEQAMETARELVLATTNK